MKIDNRTHLENIKKLFASAIVILTLYSCAHKEQGQNTQNQEQLNGWTKLGIKGKVKSNTNGNYWQD